MSNAECGVPVRLTVITYIFSTLVRTLIDSILVQSILGYCTRWHEDGQTIITQYTFHFPATFHLAVPSSNVKDYDSHPTFWALPISKNIHTSHISLSIYTRIDDSIANTVTIFALSLSLLVYFLFRAKRYH